MTFLVALCVSTLVVCVILHVLSHRDLRLSFEAISERVDNLGQGFAKCVADNDAVQVDIVETNKAVVNVAKATKDLFVVVDGQVSDLKSHVADLVAQRNYYGTLLKQIMDNIETHRCKIEDLEDERDELIGDTGYLRKRVTDLEQAAKPKKKPAAKKAKP